MGKVAFVLADDFEDTEYGTPKAALLEAGHEIDVIGSDPGLVRGKHGTEVPIDLTVGEADADDYDALVIPGGFSPDHLRDDERVVGFVVELAGRGVPVAAICHAPSLLIEADLVDGRTVTSWPSIRTDLTNAGATVVDEDVVVDGTLITSRGPEDLPRFVAALLEQMNR